MDVVLVLITWLVGIGLCVMLMYWIVTSAIDSSKLTNEINELKQLVQQLVNDKENPAYIHSSLSNQLNDKWLCPDCNKEFNMDNHICTHCALNTHNKSM